MYADLERLLSMRLAHHQMHGILCFNAWNAASLALLSPTSSARNATQILSMSACVPNGNDAPLLRLMVLNNTLGSGFHLEGLAEGIRKGATAIVCNAGSTSNDTFVEKELTSRRVLPI